ncbi:MAG: Maf family protein [Fervidobacterium sp.]
MLILASSSPRRVELLRKLNLEFITVPPNISEEVKCKKPEKLVVKLAIMKANTINHRENDIIIAADTVVWFCGRVMTKPKDEKDAKMMLRELSGKWHKVFTGVCLKIGNEEITFYEMTKVKFRKLKESEIDYYVSTGEPLDKAGAYGIQGLGGVFVEKIIGDYTNVVGLPIPRLWGILFDRGLVGKNEFKQRSEGKIADRW